MHLHPSIPVPTAFLCAITTTVVAQNHDARPDTIRQQHTLSDVVVSGQGGGTRSRVRIDNVDLIGQQQLVRAACCNLGESFVANPSVDVNYSDAATGAQQIKLLGLSGTYVQMMTENVPNLRGAALPLSLSFVPGPWMQSIQVSKGASSVRNGYESTTGQINIEYLKPQGTDGVRANAYLDSDLRYEFNLDASRHFTDRFSASILTHFNDFQGTHDENGDTFVDMPRERQWNVMPRLAYVSPHYISQLSFRALRDERESGQIGHAQHLILPYEVGLKTDRYEVQWKNGFPFNDAHNTSVALMLHGSWHDAGNQFGLRQYNVLQKNGYAQLMFETDLTERHNLSVGLSANHDYYREDFEERNAYYYFDDAGLVDFVELRPGYNWHTRQTETTLGAYAQYTYKVGDRLSVMAGIRADHTDLYRRWFVTPRLHVKYSPTDWFTLRASAGKGYRTPHALAENSSLLAMGRDVRFAYGNSFVYAQEEAWNYGASIGITLPIGDKTLDLNAEYYYTHFLQQLVIDYYDDIYPGNGTHGNTVKHELIFYNLDAFDPDARSYSHTFQVDASYPLFEGLTALAAFRLNDVRTSYYTHRTGSELRRKPLTSRYKALLTLSYKTPLELWHFDVTGQLNGPGDLYNRYSLIYGSDLPTTYPAYFQLQAQVTREFRYFSLYLGGENLTNYTIPDPILSADRPWSSTFDATQVWGPVDGIMFYAGIRFNFETM